MKVVISRKGFDSSAGWMPSPILEDGRLVPLPIPSKSDNVRMDEVDVAVDDLDGMLRDLSGRKHPLTGSTRVHLDPLLVPPPHAEAGWRPSLGQTGSAASHLEKQGVGRGDLFLFFGWFRRVEQTVSGWAWLRGAPDIHVLFGWLEVDDWAGMHRDRVHSVHKYPWLASHPHAGPTYTDSRNGIYVGSTRSRILGPNFLGGGRFPAWHPALQLTCGGKNNKRSLWDLPGFFLPQGRPPLTYHANPNRWTAKGDRVRLKTVGRGQEFVIDSQHYPALESWAVSTIQMGTVGL